MEAINFYNNSKTTLMELIIDKSNNFNKTEEEISDLEKLYIELYKVIDIIDNYNEKHNLEKDSYYLELIEKINKTPLIINYNEKKYDTFPIEKKNAYTKEEALNIVRWTVNNTRDNLTKSKENSDIAKDDYTGACGFSQFSSLYPLEKLGLEVTINNTYNFSSNSHAFGTVIIPVLDNNVVVNKQYLIDCTYSQFFKISDCVPNNVVKVAPGFYMKNEKEEFSRKLLEDGFVEATEDNLKDYWYGFYMSSIDKEKYSNMDILKVINEKNEEYDFDEEEFTNLGYNLDINNKNKKM